VNATLEHAANRGAVAEMGGKQIIEWVAVAVWWWLAYRWIEGIGAVRMIPKTCVGWQYWRGGRLVKKGQDFFLKFFSELGLGEKQVIEWVAVAVW
jgi:hypothetical protein